MADRPSNADIAAILVREFPDIAAMPGDGIPLRGPDQTAWFVPEDDDVTDPDPTDVLLSCDDIPACVDDAPAVEPPPAMPEWNCGKCQQFNVGTQPCAKCGHVHTVVDGMDDFGRDCVENP